MEVKYNTEVREGIKRGVDALANAVKVTLGPKGRNVIIDKGDLPPHITKDGVTVADAFSLEDRLENMGARMVKEVAKKSATLAGDGTTTATVLAQAIVNEGLKLIAAGFNPLDIKNGIDKTVKVIVEELERISIKIDYNSAMLKQVAIISANNDIETGELVADAFNRVGEQGVISVEESKGNVTYVDVVNGMQFDRGLISHFFSTDAKKVLVKMDDPLMVIVDKKLSKVDEVMDIIEPLAKSGKNIIIIAEDVDGQALQTLTLNKLRAGLKIAAIKAPGFGNERKELLTDIATLVGSKVLGKNSTFGPEYVGSCSSIDATERNTVIIGGKGSIESIEKRIDYLKKELDQPTTFEKDRILKRIAKLSGGVAVIYVGASSELEMKEKKDRIDDAKEAVLSALQEGIVSGGGLALLNCRSLPVIFEPNTTEGLGASLLMKAIEAPFRTICENAGVSADVKLEGVVCRPEGTGYNAKTNEYVLMIDEGIIDPKKVTRVALESAASVAGTILTTECALIRNKLG